MAQHPDAKQRNNYPGTFSLVLGKFLRMLFWLPTERNVRMVNNSGNEQVHLAIGE
jgi:hypothetical protein